MSQRQYTRVLNVIATAEGTAATITNNIPVPTFFNCEILQRSGNTFERTGETIQVRNDFAEAVPINTFLRVAYEENGEVGIIVWPC